MRFRPLQMIWRIIIFWLLGASLALANLPRHVGIFADRDTNSSGFDFNPLH
jgi:hypothetical protein